MHRVFPAVIAAVLLAFGTAQAQAPAGSRGTAAEAIAMVDKAIAHIKPVARAIEPKSMFLQRYEDIIVGCGVYKG
jgi:hypothetical protein